MIKFVWVNSQNYPRCHRHATRNRQRGGEKNGFQYNWKSTMAYLVDNHSAKIQKTIGSYESSNRSHPVRAFPYIHIIYHDCHFVNPFRAWFLLKVIKFSMFKFDIIRPCLWFGCFCHCEKIFDFRGNLFYFSGLLHFVRNDSVLLHWSNHCLIN